MPRDDVMSTPIFDELLREMAERTDPSAPTPPRQNPSPTPTQTPTTNPPPRRRHRAD